MKIIRLVVVFGLIILLSVNLQASNSNLEFAKKLSKTYPKIALRYMEKNKDVLSTRNQIQYDATMYHIYFQLANFSRNAKARMEWLLVAKKHFDLSGYKNLKKASGYRRFAMMLEMDLPDYRINAESKKNILIQVDTYYLSASQSYEKVCKDLKKKYEDGLEAALLGGRAFQRTPAFSTWSRKVYQPFAISSMRMFECYVDNLFLRNLNEKINVKDIEKMSEKASDATYVLEALIPYSSITVSVGRMYGFLAISGDKKTAKENKAKGLLALEEVLSLTTRRAVDRELLLNVKRKAILGKVEIAFGLNDVPLANETFKAYSKMFRNIRVSYDDYKIYDKVLTLLSRDYQKSKKSQVLQKIEKIKLSLNTKVKSSAFWKRKSLDLILKVDAIIGLEVKDAALLFQMAKDCQHQNNYNKAIVYFDKAFNLMTKNTSNMTMLKHYYSLAFCHYKLNQNKRGLLALRNWQRSYSILKLRQKEELSALSAKVIGLRPVLAKRIYLENKTNESLSQFKQALNDLKIIQPERALFELSDLYSKTNQLSLSLVELNKIKSDSSDYDKALYLKGYFCYKQFNQLKMDDQIKLRQSGEKALAHLSATQKYLRSVKGIVSKSKSAKRSKWQKESGRLSAYINLRVGRIDAAIESFAPLLLTSKGSEKLSVVRFLFNCYLKKQDSLAIEKSEELLVLMKSLSVSSQEKKVCVQAQKNLGLFLIKNSANKKENAEKGLRLLLDSCRGSKVKSLDLFVAQQFMQIKNYTNAKKYFELVLAKHMEDDYSDPLVKRDFETIQNGFSNDKDLFFFKRSFTHLAVNKRNKSTRDLTRLRANLSSLMKESKDEVWRQIKSKRVWRKNLENGNFQKVSDKLETFLKYLGIVDELYFCSVQLDEFNKALEYLKILKEYYPGVISQEIQSSDLLFKLAKSNLEKNNKALGLKQMKKAKDEFVKLKIRLKNKRGQAIYRSVNEKRLLCYVWIFKQTKDKSILEKIHLGLSVLYSDQAEYRTYQSLFSALVKINQLPKHLKPLSIAVVEKRNQLMKENAKKRHVHKLKNLLAVEELELIKRNNSSLLLDCSFKSLEFKVLPDKRLAHLKEVLLSIIKKEEVSSDVATYFILTEKYNEMLIDVDLVKKIPQHDLNNANTKAIIDQMNRYISEKGKIKSAGDNKIIYWNRKILKLCYPKMPPLKFNPQGNK